MRPTLGLSEMKESLPVDKPVMNYQKKLALVLAASLLSACSAEKIQAPIDPPVDDAAGAVITFTRLADSVAKSGGDSELGTAYASLAEAVRTNGRISPVTISINGVPTAFLATAQQAEISNSPCGATVGCLAPTMLSIQRSFIAWQKDNPKRIVQLTSASDRDTVQTLLYPSFAPLFYPTALLVFMDGQGGTYFGTSGRQSAVMTASTIACATTADKPVIAIYPAPPTCTNADFLTAFSAKVEPSSFLVGKNNATGSHTLSMPATNVQGARLQFAPGLPPKPPILVTPSVSLPAGLAATVDGDVTLTYTVTNSASTPITVTFNSSQNYDFRIIDSVTGATVWTSSAAKVFLAALTTKSIGANTSVIYTEKWKPTQKGTFYVVASLTSQSHRADAKQVFTVK